MKKHKRIRLWIQAFFFVLIGLFAVNHALAAYGQAIPFISSASLHALCPFGGVVTVYQLLSVGTFVKKIHASSVVLMAIVFTLTVLAGPLFCGWVCPLGSIQEWFGRLGRKIMGRRYNHILAPGLDRILRYLRYIMLFWVLYMTARSGQLIFASIDPYHALFTFWTSDASWPGIAVLILTLSLSLLVERPWCKYACPYGALLGLGNLVRIFPIRRNNLTCIQCKKCDRGCPMNISISNQAAIRDHQCISCLDCTSEHLCPVADTVNLQARRFVQPEPEIRKT